METYSVKEVADMFHTDPETVRRWIRTGKLKAEKQDSKKEGIKITGKMLGAFLEESPKYAGLATMSSVAALATGGIAVAGSIIAGAIFQGEINKAALDNARVKPADLVLLLNEELKFSKRELAQKETDISRIQKEISNDKQKVIEIEDLISKLSGE